MEEKKLTDEEIVKALELCANGLCEKDCPAFNLITGADCQDQMNNLALDLIQRLQSENERLTEKQVNLKAEIAAQELKYEELKCGRKIAVGICEVLDEAKKTEIRMQTAKEILQSVDNESNGQTVSATNVLRKRYGLEVK